jgi:general secretion pathway protein L
MPGKILGIDISRSYISAVQVISGYKGYQVVSCFSEPVIDNNTEKALEKLTGRIDLKSDRTLLSIPPSGISFRNIETPFKDAKKIRQTLPFEIESHVPFSVDGVVIDYTNSDADNPSFLLTAAAGKPIISGYIDLLQKAGFDPDIIDVRPMPAVIWLLDQEKTPLNGIYLDLEPEHPSLVIFKGKKIAVIRELPCSFQQVTGSPEPDKPDHPVSDTVENIIRAICTETLKTLHSYSIRDRNSFQPEKIYFGGRLSSYGDAYAIINSLFEVPSERINVTREGKLRMDLNLSAVYDPALMDNALALAVEKTGGNSGFNFRRDDFKVKKSILGQAKYIKTAIIMLALLFLMLIINLGTDYYFVSKRHSEINKEFDKKVPEFSGIKNVRGKITAAQQKLNSLKNPSSDLSNEINPDQNVLDILKDISVRINNKYAFDISTLTIRSSEVTLTAKTDSFDTVTKIKNALKASSLYKNVVVIDSKQKDDGVILDLKLERADQL